MIAPYTRFRPRAIHRHRRALYDFAMSTASTGNGATSVSSRMIFSPSRGLANVFRGSRTTGTFDGRGGILTNALPFQIGPSKSQWNFYSNQRARVPRMSDCQTLEEAVEATHDHLDILSPRDVAAFWAVVPKFIQKRNRAGMVNGGGHGEGRQMRQQFDSILCHTIEGMSSYGYRDLAQTTLAFAKIVKNVGVEGKNMPNLSPRKILHDLMVGADSEDKHFIFQEVTLASMALLGEFDARHLSNFIYAFGLAGHNHEFEDGSSFFDMLALAAIPKLKRFNSQDLSNMLLAYAHVGLSNSQLFGKAGDVIDQGSLETFKEQEIANIMWAYAKVNEPHPKLFKKVVDHIMALDNLGAFDPQNHSNIVWAYATLNEHHPKLFKKVADHIAARKDLEGFKPQGLSNIVWAYAKANERQPKLFKNVADHIAAFNDLEGFKETFKEQEIANIVWAFAKANERHPKLFQKVADHIMELGNLGGFNPQNLSNIVWAFATLNEPHPKLFKKVANHIMALGNLGEFDPQALSNIVWAFATLNEPHPKLFQKVTDHIVALNDLGGFIPQALSNVAWAHATTKEYHPALFQKLGEAAIQRKAEFNSQGVANFLWAHATSGNSDVTLFQTLAPTAEARLDECNAQNLANIAWAFAVVNVPDSSLFGENFAKACKDKEHEFLAEHLRQLHQWQIWQEELKTHITLHRLFSKRCGETFSSLAPRPSALQDDVISMLKAIGLHPEEEVLTKRGYRLDAVVKVNGNKIGIEVDGPSHFIGRRPTGSTILKRRQVANVDGLPIVSVPYWEWNKLKRDSNKKQKYLCSLLGLSQS